MTFRSSILIPLTVVGALVAAPAAVMQTNRPVDHGTVSPTVTSCLRRTDVQLCLMEIPSMRGYSRVPAEAPGH